MCLGVDHRYAWSDLIGVCASDIFHCLSILEILTDQWRNSCLFIFLFYLYFCVLVKAGDLVKILKCRIQVLLEGVEQLHAAQGRRRRRRKAERKKAPFPFRPCPSYKSVQFGFLLASWAAAVVFLGSEIDAFFRVYSAHTTTFASFSFLESDYQSKH